MDKDSLVVYKVYGDAMKANMDATLLRSCDIFCSLADENIVTVNPFYTQAVGGIKLQVRACDVDTVTEILNATPVPVSDEEIMAAANDLNGRKWKQPSS